MGEHEGRRNDNESNWVTTIIIVVVIVGSAAAYVIPAFGRVRSKSQWGVIHNNIGQIRSAANQFFTEEAATIAYLTDVIGTDKYVKAVPHPVAGERYEMLFPIKKGNTHWELSKSDGNTVRLGYGPSNTRRFPNRDGARD